MNIVGIGIDNADISRYENKEILAKKILTENELKEYNSKNNKAEYLASRFAVKEAYIKAKGKNNIELNKIEVRKDNNGKPLLFVNNKEIKAHLSITHDKIASAVVILYE